MNYVYSPYIPIGPSFGETWTNLTSANANQINYANGQITFTGNGVSAGNIQLTGGTYTPTSIISTGANMPASFVSDKYVQAELYSQRHQEPVVVEKSIHEKMTEAAKNGAALHPLLKTVIDEANELERQKKELASEIENLKSLTLNSSSVIGDKNKIIAEKEALIQELERKVTNQTNTLKDLQTAHEELLQAHGDLRQIIRDYSEDSVNEIVEDYQTQLASYEDEIRYYEGIIEQYQREKKAGSESLNLVASMPETGKFTKEQTEEIVAAFRRDLAAIQDPKQCDEILKKMNGPVGGYSKEEVDKLVADAKAEGKLELLAQQDAEISHDEKMTNIGSGAKVWQASTGRGPFWTQLPKIFRFRDKEQAPGWIVRNTKGKEEHYPIGDLTDKEPVRKGPNKLKIVLASTVNAVGTQLLAYQAFGAKAIIPMAIAQTIIAGITYWEFSKK